MECKGKGWYLNSKRILKKIENIPAFSKFVLIGMVFEITL